MTRHSNMSGHRSEDWLAGVVKSNPEGLLLMAAGCALLLRSTGSAGRRYSASRASQGAGGQSGAPGVSRSVSQAAQSARDYASDLGKTVSDTAGEYASTVGDYADGARRTIVDQSERLVGQARETMQATIGRVLKEQPLALAVAGLAAGAALASAFPTTDAERQTLGPAGARLSEAASSIGENLSRATSKAGEKLMDAADERGLNAEGLKEVASDVASTFGDAFSGSSNKRDPQTSSSPGANDGSVSNTTSRPSSQGSGQSDRSPPTGTTKRS
jgi:hypothetical protein